MVVISVSILYSGCMSIDLASLMRDRLKEVTVIDREGKGVYGKILLVNVSGIIAQDREGGAFGSSSGCSPDYMKAVLNKARKDSDIKGVILRIDSPGGEVTASDIIAHEIKKYSDETKIPVYSVAMSMNCSGAYYISCSSSRLYAHPTSIMGSIGVIASFPQLIKLADKVGVEMAVIKSGAMKDIGSLVRNMTQEERAVIQSIVDDSYDKFLNIVMSARKTIKSKDDLKMLADGRVYTAEQSLKGGLIDKIGYLEDAVGDMKNQAGIGKLTMITYAYSDSEDANIYSASTKMKMPAVGSMNVTLPLPYLMAHPGLYYIWQPGW